ncbi:hypothetical protein PQR02_15895 [Paraburkholderia sediminicola]|uniref:Uncharacterized protein n=1 Tax=Paraburkholderia rhynchosiae TaxID=487049 RepID=A0ACC7NCK1_9BURK
MSRSSVRTGIAVAVACAALQLGGCGSGDSGAASSGTTAVTASSITGTVAAGSALAGATVTLIDSTGAQASATTNTQAAYTIS